MRHYNAMLLLHEKLLIETAVLSKAPMQQPLTIGSFTVKVCCGKPWNLANWPAESGKHCHGKWWSFVIRGSMMMTTNNIGEMTGRSMTAKMTPFYVTVTTVAVIDMVCGRHCCRRHCLPCGRHCLPCGRHLVAVIVYPVAVILWPSLSTLWPHCLLCGRHWHGLWPSFLWPSLLVAIIV